MAGMTFVHVTLVTEPWIAPNVSATLDVLGAMRRMATIELTTTRNVRPGAFAIVKRPIAIVTMVLRGMPATILCAPTIAMGMVLVSSSVKLRLIPPCNTVRFRIANTTSGTHERIVCVNVMLIGRETIVPSGCAPKATTR